jgi:hypothetical protein
VNPPSAKPMKAYSLTSRRNRLKAFSPWLLPPICVATAILIGRTVSWTAGFGSFVLLVVLGVSLLASEPVVEDLQTDLADEPIGIHFG